MKHISPLHIQIFLILALLFSLFASIWQHFEQKQLQQNQDFSEGIVFVLDVSLSMQVQDIENTSRLGKAKEIILDILSQSSLPIGLSIFSGEAQKILPFTSDDTLFVTVLPSLDERNLSLQGSDISAALKSGLSHFSKDISSGTLVFLTDGGEDIPSGLEKISGVLKQNSIELFLVGVATKKGGPIPIGSSPFGEPIFKRYKGDIVISQIQEANLKVLAEKLGGKYMSFSEFEKNTKKLFLSHNSSQKEDSSFFIYLSLFFWGVYVSFLVFLKFSLKSLGTS